ncbi:DUF4349 domain-containing protein [Actinocrinis puniceicyclus]|uniref:DUF4349 domain-containing protein n=1 Tax=Actinocrinis puniceicyclus TaxID=977794 RepID=A0A8J7WMC2_9ACTN|nr:DUF4349 domain-containing protein [Actinocrinis puniceicyclus]MBS2965011.1 DUF4349 domain-containing protein [Actinocrinis puniceicyclus]
MRERRHDGGRGIRAAAGVVLLGGVLALSACSSGASRTSASSAGRQEGGAAAGSAQAPQALKQYSAGSADAGGGSAAANSGTAVRLPSRDLVVTAGLQVKTADAAAAAAKAANLAQAAGGYVANESIGSGTQVTPVAPGPVSSDAATSGSADGGTAPAPVGLPPVEGSDGSEQAVLVLRVPPQNVDSVLAALAGKGTVTYQSRTSTDVTGQVADVASRVASARDAIAQLRTLIDKAASMNDLISLEQALSQRESDLESLEAQQKALSDQVQFATITVGYFSQGRPATPPAPAASGFMRGLTAGWHGFLAVVRAVLAAAGWLVPYAVVVAVLWWPLRRLVRWSRRRGRGQGGGGPGAPGAVALAQAGPAAAEGTASSSEE